MRNKKLKKEIKLVKEIKKHFKQADKRCKLKIDDDTKSGLRPRSSAPVSKDRQDVTREPAAIKQKTNSQKESVGSSKRSKPTSKAAGTKGESKNTGARANGRGKNKIQGIH